MKIDFLREISYSNKGDGIVRIFDFDESEAKNLATSIYAFVNNRLVLNLSELNFMELGNVSLSFEIADSDLGIREVSKNTLVCSLTRDGFEKMVELVKPFGVDRMPGSYQYLYDADTPIEFIMSSTGEW